MNIGKKNIYKRIFSFLLVFAMFFGVLPTPTVSASSFGNMQGGEVHLPPSGGGGDGSWNSTLNSWHGYKVSVFVKV